MTWIDKGGGETWLGKGGGGEPGLGKGEGGGWPVWARVGGDLAGQGGGAVRASGNAFSVFITICINS